MEEDAWGAPETNNNKRGSSLYTKPSSHRPLLVLKELIEEVERGGREARKVQLLGSSQGPVTHGVLTFQLRHFK